MHKGGRGIKANFHPVLIEPVQGGDLAGAGRLREVVGEEAHFDVSLVDGIE